MPTPHRTAGVAGGEQKEDAIKLIVCIGGGDHLQAINQQAKISFAGLRNIMPQNHKCKHPTGPQGGKAGIRKKMQSSLLCALVGGRPPASHQPANQDMFDCHRTEC